MQIWNTLFGKLLMTVLVSMLPVVELRGAIPIAVAQGLDFRAAICAAIIGNLIPVPFLILFVRRIFAWLRKLSHWLDGLVRRVEQNAEKHTDLVMRSTFWGLVILVAIPFPGTGAWTGAIVAAMLNMRLKRAFPAIALGVVIAGVIVSFVTYGAGSVLG